MEKLKKRAILNGLGLLGVIGATIALYFLGIFDLTILIFTLVACSPMIMFLWEFAGCMNRDTIRILRKKLPKAGFSIVNTEWNDAHTAIRFHGIFQGDKFIIEAVKDNAYVLIYDLPWQGVKVSDPIVPRMLEAINEVNSCSSNMSVIMCEPNDEGIRQIYTLCYTILPEYHPEQYLSSLMSDMLSRKPAFVEAVRKERPYMAQRRGQVGFNVPAPASDENAENQSEPGDKDNSPS